MAQRNDQVFQLSLTEIAFTISFILLLLLGYLVFKEQTARVAAESALAKVQSDERIILALDDAKKNLTSSLQQAGAANPNEVIAKLVAAQDARDERDRLRKQVEDLDSKLTALTELQKELEKAAPHDKPEITKEEIKSALALQNQIRKALYEEKPPSLQNSQPNSSSPSSAKLPLPSVGEKHIAEPLRQTDDKAIVPNEPNDRDALTLVKQSIRMASELKTQLKSQLNSDVKFGDEKRLIQEVVASAKGYGELVKGGANPGQVRKENSDLRGQVAFLKNRLDARGGRDFPPCWADETGKVEFLFAIEVKPDSVVVTPAWPPGRELAALALPGISEVLAGALSNQIFPSRIQGIFNWSKSRDPECRHYVQLKSSIPDAVQSDRSRLMVENYFYKTEARR